MDDPNHDRVGEPHRLRTKRVDGETWLAATDVSAYLRGAAAHWREAALELAQEDNPYAQGITVCAAMLEQTAVDLDFNILSRLPPRL